MQIIEAADHLISECVNQSKYVTLQGNQFIIKSINMRDFRFYQRWCLLLCPVGLLRCSVGLTDSDVSETRRNLFTPRHGVGSKRRTDSSNPSVAINYQYRNKLTYQSIHQFTPVYQLPRAFSNSIQSKRQYYYRQSTVRFRGELVIWICNVHYTA